MHRTVRALAVLAAACAAVLPSVAAHAADGDVDSFTIVGTIQLAPAIPLVGGTGEAALNTSTCETVSSDGEFGACTFNGGGVYNSIACGVGSMVLQVPATELADGQIDYVVLDITYEGGIGAVAGGATGMVTLTPIEAGPVPGTCTNEFEVAGTLVLN